MLHALLEKQDRGIVKIYIYIYILKIGISNFYLLSNYTFTISVAPAILRKLKRSNIVQHENLFGQSLLPIKSILINIILQISSNEKVCSDYFVHQN